jgi:RHS repeat-associated protein
LQTVTPGDDGTGGYAPIAIVIGSTLRWVHGNHLGVPIVYTSNSGAVITTPAYTLPGFPGQLRTFADLYYNLYRDYDPTTGRYIQADPIGLAGGQAPYLYAMGNPVRYVDPDGRIPLIIALPLGGLIIGGGVLAIHEWIGHNPLNPGREHHICFFKGYGGGRSGGGGMSVPRRGDGDDFCGERAAEEMRLCEKNYGDVWGYDHFSYQGCKQRTKIREDMCRRGLEPPPRWSDLDLGDPFLPNRKR